MAQQHLLYIVTTVEPVWLKHTDHVVIESLDHAFGFWVLWILSVDVLYLIPDTAGQTMVAARPALLAGKQALRELLAVVGHPIGLFSAFLKWLPVTRGATQPKRS